MGGGKWAGLLLVLMCMVIGELPLLLAGGFLRSFAARQAGRDGKRQGGPKAPIPCSFNKNKDSL